MPSWPKPARRCGRGRRGSCGSGRDRLISTFACPAAAGWIFISSRWQAPTCRSGWHPAPFDPATSTGAYGNWPAAWLVLVGHGEGIAALARLALTLGLEVDALSPDERALAALRDLGLTPRQLERTSDTHLLASDPWTAIAFLFHDHDWESALLQRALALPHFYVGAMGGRRAHAARCAALSALGVSAAAIATIRAPIGLFHSSRDPDTLALSTLAEIVRAYQAADFGGAHG